MIGTGTVDPNGTGSITWDEEFGVQVTVSGSAGLDELDKVAESLELIDADDPRLSGLERYVDERDAA